MAKHIELYSADGISHTWRTPINQYYVRNIYHEVQPELSKSFPLYLKFVNDEHCFKKYYRHREASEVFSIELVLKGSMNFVQNDKKYRAEAGSVALIHHGQNNKFSTGPEGYCHRLACALGGTELNNILHKTRLIEHDIIKLNNFETVEKTMRECFEEFKEKSPGFRRRASILGYKLLLELEENLEQINTSDLLLRAVDLMEHHLSQHLTVEELTEALGTAPATLNRVFRQQFNTSTIDYFINLKMEAAKSLLTSTNMQIQEIAQNTGYSSSLYFSSEFKKRVGLSPREFRKKQFNNALF